MATPRVSVISIAVSEDEFRPIRNALARQTLQDLEFIGEVGGTIPQAWTRAVARARGEVLVFTETDAMPVNERWLEELLNSLPDDQTLVKGLEITGTAWDLSNLACYRRALAGMSFDEEFRWAEDTELFCRLKQHGYRLVQVDVAPVIHRRKLIAKRQIRRAFRYGLYWARLRARYSDPIEVAGFSHVTKMLVQALLNLLGLIVGQVIYLPERWRRQRSR